MAAVILRSNAGMVKTKKILIVDDEPDITSTLKKKLEEFQGPGGKARLFEVDTINDPESVLSSYKPGFYDLLIIDIRMPKIEGFELYDKIKQIDKKVKVCFSSSLSMNYQALRIMFPFLDIECYIPKPIEIDDLVERINAEVPD